MTDRYHYASPAQNGSGLIACPECEEAGSVPVTDPDTGDQMVDEVGDPIRDECDTCGGRGLVTLATAREFALDTDEYIDWKDYR